MSWTKLILFWIVALISARTIAGPEDEILLLKSLIEKLDSDTSVTLSENSYIRKYAFPAPDSEALNRPPYISIHFKDGSISEKVLGDLESEMKKLGGGIRPINGREPPRFDVVDNRTRPLILMSEKIPLWVFHHEVAHYRLWKEKRESFIETGVSPEEAAQRAFLILATPEGTVVTESAAVSAELKLRIEQIRGGRPLDPKWIADRAIYPLLQGVGRYLWFRKESRDSLADSSLQIFTRSARTRYEWLSQEFLKIHGKSVLPSFESYIERENDNFALSDEMAATLIRHGLKCGGPGGALS